MTTQPWETDAAAVAYEFMTAGGMNTPEQVDDLLADQPDAAAWSAEAAEQWTLHVSLDDLTEALADFIANRPDRNA